MSYVDMTAKDLSRMLSIMSAYFGDKEMIQDDIDLRKKLEQAMTSTDSFGRDARSIMNTLNNIKDPETVKETVEENSDKIKAFK